MKIKNFMYRKDTGEQKLYELLVIKDDSNYMEGISLADLSKEQKEKVIAIHKEYEEKLAPFMSSYRRFTQNRVTLLEEKR